jgi:hypothetical protein
LIAKYLTFLFVDINVSDSTQKQGAMIGQMIALTKMYMSIFVPMVSTNVVRNRQSDYYFIRFINRIKLIVDLILLHLFPLNDTTIDKLKLGKAERTREFVLSGMREIQQAFAEHDLIANVRLETYDGDCYFHVPPLL